MEIVLGGRQSGKTTKLIKMSAETGAYLVCESEYEANRVFQLAQQLGLKIPYPITAYSFAHQDYYSKGVKSFLIDNAEMLLRRISKVPIDVISLTYPPEHPPIETPSWAEEYSENPDNFKREFPY